MNKSELVSSIAAKSGLSKADAKKAVDACVESIVEALKGGDKVSLVGFGTFAVIERPARQGMNPQMSYAGTQSNSLVTPRVFSVGLNVRF